MSGHVCSSGRRAAVRVLKKVRWWKGMWFVNATREGSAKKDVGYQPQ